MQDERREAISQRLWKVLTVSAASRFADEVKETVHALDLVSQVRGNLSRRNWGRAIMVLHAISV